MKFPFQTVEDPAVTQNFEALQKRDILDQTAESVLLLAASGTTKLKTANTGLITVGTFTAGTWVGVTIAHGVGVIPRGFGGHLIGTGSPSIVAGIPVAPANADATNIVFELFNTSAFNLSGGSINVNWWVLY